MVKTEITDSHIELSGGSELAGVQHTQVDITGVVVASRTRSGSKRKAEGPEALQGVKKIRVTAVKTEYAPPEVFAHLDVLTDRLKPGLDGACF